MGHHPTIACDTPAGRADIDEQLAALISALWRLGVTTRQCCQHDELSDSAEISFSTAADAAAFVAAVFPAGDDEQDELQTKIRDWQVYDPAPSTARDGWRWTAVPE